MPDTAKKKQQLDKELAELDAQITRAKEVQAKVVAQQEPIRSVYTWEAPERVFEPKERSWYVTVPKNRIQQELNSVNYPSYKCKHSTSAFRSRA